MWPTIQSDVNRMKLDSSARRSLIMWQCSVWKVVRIHIRDWKRWPWTGAFLVGLKCFASKKGTKTERRTYSTTFIYILYLSLTLLYLSLAEYVWYF